MKPIFNIKTYRNSRLEDIPIILQAASFFMASLTKGKDYGKLQVDIQIVKAISYEEESSDREHWGECFELVTKHGKHFVIRLVRDLQFSDLIKTLAHEMVHVVQGIRGDLLTTDENEWVWKGTNFGVAPYTGKEEDDTLPWEVEALSKEQTLSRKFAKQLFS